MTNIFETQTLYFFERRTPDITKLQKSRIRQSSEWWNSHFGSKCSWTPIWCCHRRLHITPHVANRPLGNTRVISGRFATPRTRVIHPARPSTAKQAPNTAQGRISQKDTFLVNSQDEASPTSVCHSGVYVRDQKNNYKLKLKFAFKAQKSRELLKRFILRV